MFLKNLVCWILYIQLISQQNILTHRFPFIAWDITLGVSIKSMSIFVSTIGFACQSLT